MENIMTKLVLAMTTVATSISGYAAADLYGLQVGLGYRQDSIQWKLEDHGETNPRCESDLHFKDLEIVTLGAKFRGMLGCSLYTRAFFDYGWVVDGRLREELTVRQHRDVCRFNNNGFFSDGQFRKAVVHNKEKGNSYVWDLNISFGVPFQCLCDGFQIAPMIGFSYDRQHLKVHNGERVFANLHHRHPEINTGRDNCEGHSHVFNSSFWGPWFGFDFSMASQDCWTFFGEFELHVGRAERSRRSHIGVQYFDRYKRTKSFWGPSIRIGANYIICQDWYLEATLGYSHWVSIEHRDDFYYSSGTARIDIGRVF